uniref:Inositol polyphosphate-related phosphatase domain-containing protein n=1 Tax=Tetranychus urticae TaxID=32264 RepID=T1K6U8_TETUR
MIGEQKVDETQNQNVIKSSESSAKSRKSSSTSLPSTAPTYSGTPTTSKSSSSTSSRAKSASSSSSSSSSGSYKIHKIEATKARSRNFIFGAIGHEGSLLGEDELKNVLPRGIVSVHLVTWNMGNRSGPDNWNEILLPSGNDYLAEIYAIGTQETPSTSFSSNGSNGNRDLTVNLQSTLGPSHVLLHSVSLGVLSLFIFIRRELIWYVSIPEDCVFNSRPKATNMVKTKVEKIEIFFIP